MIFDHCGHGHRLWWLCLWWTCILHVLWWVCGLWLVAPRVAGCNFLFWILMQNFLCRGLFFAWFSGFLCMFCMESLILAQDERWRRA